MSEEESVIRIGDLLERASLVTSADLSEAVQVSKRLQLPIGRVLIMSGCVTEAILSAALEAQSLVRDRNISIDAAVEALVKVAEEEITLKEALAKSDRLPQPGASTNKLGEILVEFGLITEKTLEIALRDSAQTGLPLGSALVKHGALSPMLLPLLLRTQEQIRDGVITRQRAVEEFKSAYAMWSKAKESFKQNESDSELQGSSSQNFNQPQPSANPYEDYYRKLVAQGTPGAADSQTIGYQSTPSEFADYRPNLHLLGQANIGAANPNQMAATHYDQAAHPHASPNSSLVRFQQMIAQVSPLTNPENVTHMDLNTLPKVESAAEPGMQKLSSETLARVPLLGQPPQATYAQSQISEPLPNKSGTWPSQTLNSSPTVGPRATSTQQTRALSGPSFENVLTRQMRARPSPEDHPSEVGAKTVDAGNAAAPTEPHTPEIPTAPKPPHRPEPLPPAPVSTTSVELDHAAPEPLAAVPDPATSSEPPHTRPDPLLPTPVTVASVELDHAAPEAPVALPDPATSSESPHTRPDPLLPTPVSGASVEPFDVPPEPASMPSMEPPHSRPDPLLPLFASMRSGEPLPAASEPASCAPPSVTSAEPPHARRDPLLPSLSAMTSVGPFHVPIEPAQPAPDSVISIEPPHTLPDPLPASPVAPSSVEPFHVPLEPALCEPDSVPSKERPPNQQPDPIFPTDATTPEEPPNGHPVSPPHTSAESKTQSPKRQHEPAKNHRAPAATFARLLQMQPASEAVDSVELPMTPALNMASSLHGQPAMRPPTQSTTHGPNGSSDTTSAIPSNTQQPEIVAPSPPPPVTQPVAVQEVPRPREKVTSGNPFAAGLPTFANQTLVLDILPSKKTPVAPTPPKITIDVPIPKPAPTPAPLKSEPKQDPIKEIETPAPKSFNDMIDLSDCPASHPVPDVSSTSAVNEGIAIHAHPNPPLEPQVDVFNANHAAVESPQPPGNHQKSPSKTRLKASRPHKSPLSETLGLIELLKAAGFFSQQELLASFNNCLADQKTAPELLRTLGLVTDDAIAKAQLCQSLLDSGELKPQQAALVLNSYRSGKMTIDAALKEAGVSKENASDRLSDSA